MMPSFPKLPRDGLSLPAALALFAAIAGAMWLFSLGHPGEPVYLRVRQAGVLVVLLPGAWLLWRGLRGIRRARALRRDGIEDEATVLRAWVEARRVQQPRESLRVRRTTISHFLDYEFELGGERHVARRVWMPNPPSKLPKAGDRVRIQVLPTDPTNSRLLSIPSHATFVMRGLQSAAGAGIVAFALLRLAPGYLWGAP